MKTKAIEMDLLKKPYVMSKMDMLVIAMGGEDEVDTSFTHLTVTGRPNLDPRELINEYPEVTPNHYHDPAAMSLIHIGRFGRVYETDNMIVKVLQKNQATDEEIDEFYREIIIGLEITKLNNPAFVKTLGYATMEDKDGDESVYLYREKVEGIVMQDFVCQCSAATLKKLLRQLLVDYAAVVKSLNFSHYDLHLANIIIVGANRDQIMMDGDQLRAVIIDFGSSHISLAAGDVGQAMPLNAVYADRSMWTQDIFKLFGYLYSHLDDQRSRGTIDRYFKQVRDLTKKKHRPIDTFANYWHFVYKHLKNEEIRYQMRVIHETCTRQTYRNFYFEHYGAEAASFRAFTLKVLSFLLPGLADRQLMEYHAADEWWRSYPTAAGEVAKLNDFIAHFNQCLL